jgi:hypothetical protein
MSHRKQPIFSGSIRPTPSNTKLNALGMRRCTDASHAGAASLPPRSFACYQSLEIQPWDWEFGILPVRGPWPVVDTRTPVAVVFVTQWQCCPLPLRLHVASSQKICSLLGWSPIDLLLLASTPAVQTFDYLLYVRVVAHCNVFCHGGYCTSSLHRVWLNSFDFSFI